MRISDWSSDVCSSDLLRHLFHARRAHQLHVGRRVDQLDLDFLVVELAFSQLLAKHLTCSAAFVLALAARLAKILGRRQQYIEHAVLGGSFGAIRSEEHTSELPSLMRISYAVFCLKKQTKTL